MSEKLQHKLDMVDIKDTLLKVSVETKDDDVKNETDMKDFNHRNENYESSSSKSSRELKLLLALSKEANLDTNIVHKRKSTETLCKTTDKSESTDAADIQRKMRPTIIRVDYNKPDVDNSEIQETKDCLTNKIIHHEELDDAINRDEDTDLDTAEQSNRSTSSNVVIVINDKRKDPFCWRCNHEKPTFYCETCPRSFHQKCLKHNVTQADRWICPVCVGILKAENLMERSPAMREMSLEHFCGLLKFALKRMMQVEGHEPFIQPVNEADFPEYKKYVAQPQDLTSLEKNIKSNVYGSPQAFEADAQWILHNSIIFNSYQSKLTSIAKSMMKICKQEMSEIENCANCYLNANTKKKTWFVEVCPKPHLVVWAKLKGFPYWPAKAMRTNSLGMVDVRFFGAHDRAWVPCKDCFLYCSQDPNSNRQKRNDINESIKELNIYIENLKRMYGEFRCAPYRVIVDPEQELKQLRMILPRYDPEKRVTVRGFRKSLHRNGNCSPDLESSERSVDESPVKVEDFTEDVEQDDCNTSDDSSSVTNHNSNAHMHGGFVNTSGRFKVLPKTYPAKRRSSSYEDDSPPKLTRHDSNECVTHSDSENSERETDTNKVEDSNPTNGIDCPQLTDETKAIIESPTKSTITDLLYKKLADLIDQEPEKDKIVTETDLLLDTLNNSIDSFVPKPLELSVVKFDNVTESPPVEEMDTTEDTKVEPKETDVDTNETIKTVDTAATETVETVTKTKDSVETVKIKTNEIAQTVQVKPKEITGRVEVIEVNVTEIPEFTQTMELEVPGNIQDIVQASDISTVSISAVEDELPDNIPQYIDREKVHSPVRNNLDLLYQGALNSTLTNSMESLDQNLTSCSSTDEYTNPLDFVEVTENIPIDERSTIEEEEEAPISEKTEDTLDMQKIGFTEKTKTTLDAQQSNKRRRSSGDGAETSNAFEKVQKNKSLRLINIDDIKMKVLDNTSVSSRILEPVSCLLSRENNISPCPEPLQSLQSLLEKHLCAPNKNAETPEHSETVVIKSEPNSEDEQNDAEYMEQKRRYLSALNISEKLPEPPKKPISMRTRSKSEENKIKFGNSISRVIDDVAACISTTPNHDIINTPPKRKEIFVKPLSKMILPKQKARKSFPMPVRTVYPGPSQKKEVVRVNKPLLSTSIRTSPIIKPNEMYTTPNNIMYITHSPSTSNAVTILPPNQPITYSCSRGNPILTMVPHSNNYSSLTPTSTPSKTSNEQYESQNYIPLCGEVVRPRTASTVNLSRTTPTVLENGVTTTIVTQATSTVSISPIASNTVLTATSATSEILDGLGTISSLTPDTLNKTISDIMCRAPPKLKRRPPGPLSAHFDEGLPSSAGTVASRVNSISHRLGDYFRGMLIELLQEMSTTDNPEVEITKLKLENEELKHKHNEEIVEIKKNVSTILKDVQKSIEEERTRIIEDTRSACETECVKRVEEAKSKQWCSHCSKEAQFYCCWNTSYCDFPCQEKHWSKHMSNCTQNIQNSRPPQSNSTTVVTTTATPRPTQSLILRQTTAPKGFTPKALIAKPTKVIVNRPGGAKNSISYVRTTSGSHITLVESTPGNYELVGNGGPISVGGKFITGLGKIRTGNVISVPSSSSAPSTSTGIVGNTPKTFLLNQTKPPQTTTVISDEE